MFEFIHVKWDRDKVERYIFLPSVKKFNVNIKLGLLVKQHCVGPNIRQYLILGIMKGFQVRLLCSNLLKQFVRRIKMSPVFNTTKQRRFENSLISQPQLLIWCLRWF